MTPALIMNFLILPLASLIFAAAVSGSNWGSVVVDPVPVYEPQVEKTYKYEKEVKVPIVETGVPIATAHVSEPILRTNGRIKSEPIVVPVEHGRKSIDQYVPFQRSVIPSYVDYGHSPVRSKVEVKTTYKSDVPTHTVYREPVKSIETPVHSYRPIEVPVHSYRPIEVPVRKSYPSYTVPIQTSYRSVHVPVETAYRSVHAPVRGVYSPRYVPYQYGQKSIHTPSVVGLRYW